MSLLKDVRYGVRMLGKSPFFTAVAALSLALGIGAGTSIFSLVNAILLRSLPVPNPHELCIIKWSMSIPDWDEWEEKLGKVSLPVAMNGNRVSLRGFKALRDQCRPLADVFGYNQIAMGTAFRARHEAIVANGI